MKAEKQHIVEHLKDLRKCLFASVISVFLALCICYFFIDHIMMILKVPIDKFMPQNYQFVVLAPHEYFFVELKTAVYSGFVLAFPLVFRQFWLFLAPGLYKSEKRLLLIFAFCASACFLMGLSFCYFLVLPPTFKFFIGTVPSNVIGTYSIAMVYGFTLSILLSFGAIFQTPIAIFLLVYFDILTKEGVKKSRPYVFVACFIIGALLTPPDPITQVMLAIPTYFLFEVGVFFASLVKRSK